MEAWEEEGAAGMKEGSIDQAGVKSPVSALMTACEPVQASTGLLKGHGADARVRFTHRSLETEEGRG